ncbi:hypothetical protein HG530_000178 [Fusarium avenaceum]|nr:hypothetical protein HG530_000178 [Fusarium avenaceum]
MCRPEASVSKNTIKKIRETYLSLVVHDTKVAPLHSLLELRIGKDDGRALATTLERDVLQVVCRILHDSPTSVGATGKGNLVNIHMSSNSLSGLGTKTRRLLSRLENDGITAGQSRGNLPSEHHEGEVPGDDLTADSQRLLEDICKLSGRCLDCLAGDLVGGSSVVAEDIVRLIEVASKSSAEGLDVNVDGGDELTVAINKIGDFVEKVTAFISSQLRPLALKGLASSLNSLVDVVCGCALELDDLFLGADGT